MPLDAPNGQDGEGLIGPLNTSKCRLHPNPAPATAPAMSILRDFPDLPPVWMLGHAVLAWAAAEWLPLVRFDGSIVQALGLPVAAIGIGLAVWAAVWFARKRTTIEPRHAPRALIVEGPFRLNRNPIYTGMALTLLGFALWLGTLSAILVVLPFPFIIDRRFIRGEERTLRDAFGAEADSYIAGTRRW